MRESGLVVAEAPAALVGVHPAGSRSRSVVAAGAVRQASFVATTSALRAADALFVRGDRSSSAAQVDRVYAAGRAAIEVLGMVDDVGGFADGYYPQAVAVSLARAVATGVHIGGQLAFTEPTQGRRPPGAATVRSLTAQQGRYDRLLASSRQVAAEGDVGDTAVLLDELLGAVQGPVSAAVGRAARLAGGAHRQADVAGLSASMMVRRMAMLAAGLVMIDWRQRRSRTRATTRQIAVSRSQLRRSGLRPAVARRSTRGLAVGDAVTVVGRVDQVRWVERPVEPYSIAELEGGLVLVAAHRSLSRQGVSPGAMVCAAGTVREDPTAGRHVKVAFAGPSTHRMSCWEDWLAVETRRAYELYPGSLAAEWELPRQLDAGRRADTYVRMV